MASYEVTMPDGAVYRLDGADENAINAAVADLRVQHPSPVQSVTNGVQSGGPKQQLQSRSDLGEDWENSLRKTANLPGGGLAESALHFGSQMLSFPVAGIASAYKLLTADSGLKAKEASEASQAVQDAMVYQPRGTVGKAFSNAGDTVLGLIPKTGEWVGDKVLQATGNEGLDAAANVGVQAIPALLGVKGIRSGLARAAGIGDTAGAAEAAAQRAKAYVANRTGLDWNQLPADFQAQIQTVAKDPKALAGLDPAAVEREARFRSLNMPYTSGQVSRDAAVLRNEGNISATEAGKPIRQVYDAQNQAILGNLDALQQQTGGSAPSPEAVGRSVQEAARDKLAAAKANVKALYQKADQSGETAQQVPIKPLQDLYAQTPDRAHLEWVNSWLNQMGGDKAGLNLTRLPIRTLEDLRQAATARTLNGGTDAYYAGKVIDAIDQTTQGAGGDLYKAARAARKQMSDEFEQQGSVAQLVENSSRTDRATALEDTWRKTVVGGSLEDLQSVKRTLLTGHGNPELMGRGVQAWRDLQAQTLQYIKDQATKGVAAREDGTANVTAAGLQRALNAVGPDKLNELFGPGTSQKLSELMKATSDAKTQPADGVRGSSTVANAMTLLERAMKIATPIGAIAGHLFGGHGIVGGIVGHAMRGVGEARAARAASAAARRSTSSSPLSDAASSKPRGTNALAWGTAGNTASNQ